MYIIFSHALKDLKQNMITTQKLKFFIKDLLSKYEEILQGKLHFFCSGHMDTFNFGYITQQISYFQSFAAILEQKIYKIIY